MDLKKSYINNKIKDYYIQKKYNKKTQNEQILKKYLEESDKIKKIEYKKNEYLEIKKKDIIYRIIYNLNKRTEEYFHSSRHKKINHESMLGCSPDELKIHFESLFKEGMSFDNYTEWEIDHIIPLSSIDFDKYYELEKVLHYTNLQPMWMKENRSKGAKIICS